jgi:hypothetical protein
MRLYGSKVLVCASTIGLAAAAVADSAAAQIATQPQAPASNSPAQDYAAPAENPPAPTNPTPQGPDSTGTMQGSAPTAQPSGINDSAQEIVVTGYRRSLAESTVAKRNATSFTDSIFAQDIGKFPDVNIAESFNRIPGITISRDITGEGTNVAIRGLGSNFTQVSLNGAPVAVASSGTTDAQGTDRSVDLSFFPTDLFTKLTVNKSYTSDLLEGGASGNIDIRSARWQIGSLRPHTRPRASAPRMHSLDRGPFLIRVRPSICNPRQVRSRSNYPPGRAPPVSGADCGSRCADTRLGDPRRHPTRQR